MPAPKFLRCLPCMQDDGSNQQQSLTDADLTTPIGRGFSRRQIAKGVAVVLSGYDSTTAAASIGGGCDAETVDLWVQMYRPPFFEDGMQCPPALILWWIKELDRKDQLALGCICPNSNLAGLNMNPGIGTNPAPVTNTVIVSNPPSNTMPSNKMRLFYPSTLPKSQLQDAGYQQQTQQQLQPQSQQQQPQQQGQIMNPIVGQYMTALQQQQQQQQMLQQQLQQQQFSPQQQQFSQQQLQLSQQQQFGSNNAAQFPKQGMTSTSGSGTGIYSMAPVQQGQQGSQNQQQQQQGNNTGRPGARTSFS